MTLAAYLQWYSYLLIGVGVVVVIAYVLYKKSADK